MADGSLDGGVLLGVVPVTRVSVRIPVLQRQWRLANKLSVADDLLGPAYGKLFPRGILCEARPDRMFRGYLLQGELVNPLSSFISKILTATQCADRYDDEYVCIISCDSHVNLYKDK